MAKMCCTLKVLYYKMFEMSVLWISFCKVHDDLKGSIALHIFKNNSHIAFMSFKIKGLCMNCISKVDISLESILKI